MSGGILLRMVVAQFEMMRLQLFQFGFIQLGHFGVIPSLQEHFVGGREIALVLAAQATASEGIEHLHVVSMSLLLGVFFVVDGGIVLGCCPQLEMSPSLIHLLYLSAHIIKLYRMEPLTLSWMLDNRWLFSLNNPLHHHLLLLPVIFDLLTVTGILVERDQQRLEVSEWLILLFVVYGLLVAINLCLMVKISVSINEQMESTHENL